MKTKDALLPLTAIALAALLAGCSHKTPPTPAPPTPPAAPAPAPDPTVTLQATSNSVERGSSTTLTWKSTNAVSVQLNGATVNLNDSQSVSPTQSTDYQAVAKNADGKTANAAVRISVTEPPPPPAAPQPTVQPIDLDTLFTENVKDSFFDFDKAQIRSDAEATLMADAQFLKAHPEVRVMIVGHCDDRGSAEYNIALGTRRANAVEAFLVQQGVDTSRIATNSVGKEDPFCTMDNDECWQQNRRGHFVRQP